MAHRTNITFFFSLSFFLTTLRINNLKVKIQTILKKKKLCYVFILLLINFNIHTHTHSKLNKSKIEIPDCHAWAQELL